jgi:hypothetical protein
MSNFKLSPKQQEAQQLLGGGSEHVMLLGGSRCVAGDTILDGHTKTIAELAEIGEPVEVLTSWGKQMAHAPFLKGRCLMLRVELDDGRSITVTPDHRFWNGRRWIKAEEIGVGSAVAVRTYSQSLPGSNSEPSRLASLEDEPYWRRKAVSFLDRCFLYFRQCGQRLLQASADALSCRALQFDVLGHSLLSPSPPFHASQLRVLDSRKDHLSRRDAKHIPFDQGSCHSSIEDGSQVFDRASLSISRVFWRICEQFLCLRSGNQQSLQLSFLLKPSSRAMEYALFQFFRFFYLSYDRPYSVGYSLAKVLCITRTAEKSYYTLHVPTSEQYFSNGILNHNSGKTFVICRTICVRAIKAEGSRHLIARHRLAHVKASIWRDTWPKMMQICFPGLYEKCKIDKGDLIITFPNKSEIWFAGLDDDERTEKILGQEFATIFLNECSQMSEHSREMVMTRLAQRVAVHPMGKPGPKPDPEKKKSVAQYLRLRAFYDENPPARTHWTYRTFIEKKRTAPPYTALPDPQNYAWMRINPADNAENLDQRYLDSLQNLSPRQKQRFWDGEFGSSNENALWTYDVIERNRVNSAPEDLVRVVVSVDPSGTSGPEDRRSDHVGITVGALGTDGKAYLLEDLTIKAGPDVWGKTVVSAYERHDADCVVGEVNFGGAMVEHVIRTAASEIGMDVVYREVRATRGKIVRAEPISALYSQNRICHVGVFQELEDQLMSFTTAGYMGDRSPDRADSWAWACTSLFPGIVRGRHTELEDAFKPQFETGGEAAGGWLRA